MSGYFETDAIVPATAMAVAPLQLAEEVKISAEPAAAAAAPTDRAGMLERLSALMLGIGAADSVVPPRVLINIKPPWHEPLVAVLGDGVEQLAQIKNVPLQPGIATSLSYGAMEYLDLPTLSALMRAGPQAAPVAGRQVAPRGEGGTGGYLVGASPGMCGALKEFVAHGTAIRDEQVQMLPRPVKRSAG